MGETGYASLDSDIPLRVGETKVQYPKAEQQERYSSACGKNPSQIAWPTCVLAISLCVREKPFQECDSFSRCEGSRFNDRRLA